MYTLVSRKSKPLFNIVLHASTVIRILRILFLEDSDTELQLELIRAVKTSNMKMHHICCAVTDSVFQLLLRLFINVFFKVPTNGLLVANEDTLFF